MPLAFRDMEIIAKTGEPQDLTNQILYLPLSL
jgi:hypothetical protein